MTDKIISVYWFTILFLVAATVVYMTSLSYQGLDVRETEANILANSVADCFAKGGVISENITENNGDFLLNNENFLEKCSLNFNTVEIYNWKNDQYFVSVKFLNLNSNEERIFFIGNVNLKSYCSNNFEEEKNLPVCFERNFYSVDKQGNNYLIKILSGVRKTEKNV